ncbi:MAG: transposase [Bacteroidota bacterium]
MSKKGKTESKVKNKLRTQRVFSDTFKRQRVKEIDEGLLSVTQQAKLYGVSTVSIYRWLHKYSPNHQKGIKQVVQMESEAHKTKVLLKRLAELERIVGQKQIRLDYYEKLIEISSAELKVDIKKNFDTKYWNISKDSSSEKDLK